MKFLFETTATMKDYNCRKWWIDSKIIPNVKIDAENVPDALKKYQFLCDDEYGVTISNNAIRKAQPMYVDDENGDAIQTGYVITGKTLFDNERANWIAQYIDLWVKISVISNPFETGETQ